MPTHLTFLYLICGSLMALMGILSLRENPKSGLHQSFFAVTVGTLLWMFALYFGFHFTYQNQIETANIFFRLAFGFGALMTVFLTAFFTLFPKKTQFSKISTFGYLSISALVIGISAFTPLVYESIIINPEGLGDILGPYYTLFLIFLFTNYGIQAGLAIRSIRKTKGIERKKIALASTGFLAFFLFTLMTNAVLPTFGIIIFQVEAPTFTLLFLIPAFYAIQRYRFFDLSYVSLQLLRTLVLLSCFLATGLSLAWGIQTLVPESPLVITGTISASSALLVYLFCNRRFPELLPKNFRDFRQQLHQLSINLSYSKSYPELIQYLEQTFVVGLQLSQVKLFLVREKLPSLDMPLYPRNACIENIENQQLTALVTDEIRLQKNTSPCVKELQQIGASLCLPLYLDKRVIGLLTLGHKADQKPWSFEELQELLSVREIITISFLNILLGSGLQEENDLIKQMIARKTKRLRKQNKEIKELLDQQSEVLATASHEFRTPLAIAMMKLEDTLEYYDHSKQALKDMKMMEDSLEKLKTLTENLFEVQHYEHHKTNLNPEETELTAYLENIMKDHQQFMKQHSLRSSFMKPTQRIMIPIDRMKMQQLVSNLLNNAIKFSPEKGEIQLAIEEKGDQILITVTDQGPGIAEERKEEVFEKFVTGDNGKEGIGMGLYLCKKIIQLHGGSIHAEDGPDGGTRMVVKMPLEGR